MRELDGRTQFEVRYGAKPDLPHLRAIGAMCCRPAAGEIEELNARSRRCSSVGYKHDGGGYKVWTRARGSSSSPEMSFSTTTASHHPPSMSRGGSRRRGRAGCTACTDLQTWPQCGGEESTRSREAGFEM